MGTILSIDPSGSQNGHTGISLLEYTDTDPVREIASWAVMGGIEGFRGWLDPYATVGIYATYVDPTGEWSDGWLDEGGTPVEVNTVIVEQFINRNIRGADISPLGMQYIVQWLWPNAVLSPAGGKNTAVSDTVLKKFDLYADGSHHHDVREARRHGVWWLKKQGHLPTLRKGWK